MALRLVCGAAAGALAAIAATPALAAGGCSSGIDPDFGNPLNESYCQAFAKGKDSVAVGTASSAQGDYSVAIGGGSLSVAAEALGIYSVAIGTEAKAWGQRSTAVGTLAGAKGVNTNSYNAAFGNQAGYDVRGSGNTALGVAAGYTVRGGLNTATGNSAGQRVAGDKNVAVGVGSGSTVTGNFNIAIGAGAGGGITASQTVAIGQDALATKPRAVAIGVGSLANVADTVSVGTASRPRRIMNVQNAVGPTDAVNLRQVKALIAVARVAPAPVARSLVASSGTPTQVALVSRNAAGSDRRAMSGAGARANSNPGGEQTASARAERGAAGFEPSDIMGWINVNRDGTPSETRNVAGTARRAAGEYEIAFQEPVRHCTYHATLADFGFVSVKPGAQGDSLKVQTRNHLGVLTDAEFSLLVVC